MTKMRTAYVCRQCGAQQAKWSGRCPECGEWNTLVEERYVERSTRRTGEYGVSQARPITEIEPTDAARLASGIPELDRVLGGGVVLGGTVLVGGDPGIGKSTLLLQAADKFASGGLKVLYVTAEESLLQTKLRARRLGVESPNLLLLAETNIDLVFEEVERTRPEAIVIDSIQMVYSPDLPSAPGSVGQVRDSAARLVQYAKRSGTPLFLIGHVTKGGLIAGPRVLEHLVDTVLYFEGDRHHAFRLLRAVKNRFGSTNELGVFEMTPQGLVEVPNPSRLFLPQDLRPVAGSTIVPCMEGSRAFLVEVQALLATAHYGSAERKVSGVDYVRVCMLLAVLERRAGLQLVGQDVFVNAAGGVRVEEPAADLAIAVAIASSFQEFPVPHDTVLIGEVGLGGEVRAVSQIETRLGEAAKLGFRRALIPAGCSVSPAGVGPLDVVPVGRLVEALDMLR